MEFPSKQLLHLLDMVKGGHSWDKDCFDAALDVIKYVYHTFIDKGEKVIGDMNFDPKAALEQLCGESEAKSFGPAIWLNLAFWLATKIIERMS